MKEKSVKIIILSLIVLCLLLTVSTFAWLCNAIIVEFPTDYGGSLEIQYFHGGDGSKEDPYVISNRVELYNLAWLQYLGYFNMNSGLNNGRAQSYFTLSNNINMQGLAIPPIGTSEYPFTGNFSGNGYEITNVIISNDNADLTLRPTVAGFKDGKLVSSTDGNTEVAQVVGFFGIVGEYENVFGYSFGTPEQISDTATEYKRNGTLTATVYENGTEVPNTYSNLTDFYKKAICVSGFYLNNINVKSTSSSTLAGVAVGYVASSISNIGVNNSSIFCIAGATGYRNIPLLNPTGTETEKVFGDKISSYSIIGDYDSTVVSWADNPTTSGSGDEKGWGGSIDFLTLSKRISYLIGSIYDGSSSTDTISKINTSTYKAVISSSAFNCNITNGTSSLIPYNWDSLPNSEYIYADLMKGSYLPININSDDMQLDGEQITNQFPLDTSLNMETNSKYHENFLNGIGETVGNNNTGYIVGGQASTSSSYGYARIRMQRLDGSNTIYKSFGNNTNTGLTYDESKLEILTYDYANQRWAIIKDEFNANTSGTLLENANYTPETVSELNLVKYNSVRPSFKNFLGGIEDNPALYGLRFSCSNYYSPLGSRVTYTTATNVEMNGKIYDSYQFVDNSINFSISKPGIITICVGAYVTVSDYSSTVMPKLYSVTRDSDNNIIQANTKKVLQIYKDGNTYVTVYNSEDKISDASKIVYDEAIAYVLPENGAVYYFEIPVTEGDYVIGVDNVSNKAGSAYIMFLDIGANSSGESTVETDLYHSLETVNFVSDTQRGANYLSYADVSFELSEVGTNGNVQVVFVRESGNTLNAENKINTKVFYRIKEGELILTPSSAEYSESSDSIDLTVLTE